MGSRGLEFDQFAAAYDQLLDDPIRTRFCNDGGRFFHSRKRDLILGFLRRQGLDGCALDYLDVGCGRAELLKLLQGDFKSVAGCDPSSEMLACAQHGFSANLHLQPNSGVLPYEDARFDFVSAVCVYHHIPPPERARLTAEIVRVLKPGGTFAIVEHNPCNPVTRSIVSRTPVDAHALLLTAGQVCALMRREGLISRKCEYFLYLPERFYNVASPLEVLLRKVPFGGQFAVFGRKGRSATPAKAEGVAVS